MPPNAISRPYVPEAEALGGRELLLLLTARGIGSDVTSDPRLLRDDLSRMSCFHREDCLHGCSPLSAVTHTTSPRCEQLL